MKTESEFRRDFLVLYKKLLQRKATPETQHIIEFFEMILSFPSGPVDVRESGADGKMPAEYFSDYTFQELINFKWTTDDPRFSAEIILEKFSSMTDQIEWANFIKRNFA